MEGKKENFNDKFVFHLSKRIKFIKEMSIILVNNDDDMTGILKRYLPSIGLYIRRYCWFFIAIHNTHARWIIIMNGLPDILFVSFYVWARQHEQIFE